MAICSPAYSLCGVVVSIWGIIQLILLVLYILRQRYSETLYKFTSLIREAEWLHNSFWYFSVFTSPYFPSYPPVQKVLEGARTRPDYGSILWLLAIMGFFYYLQSLALAEDLPLPEHLPDSPLVKDRILAYSQAADKAYAENAINCWIAACLYIITLIFSAHQFYLNNRNSISV